MRDRDRLSGVVPLAVLAALSYLLHQPAFAADEANQADRAAVAVSRRLAEREEELAQNARNSNHIARLQAHAAYRLARRRQLGFAAPIEKRIDNARAVDLAVMALGRSLSEAHAFEAEAARLPAERQALDKALALSASGPAPAAPSTFVRPCRGTVVAEPGMRRDSGTRIEARQEGVHILARMNDIVRAPGPGVIHRVEPLPQGGFGLVVEHTDGWTSVLAGLREISVAAGDPVDKGDRLGLVGRNLDGAPVVAFELWKGRRPVDPRRLFDRGP